MNNESKYMETIVLVPACVFAENRHGNLLAVQVKSSLGKDTKARYTENCNNGRRLLGAEPPRGREYPRQTLPQRRARAMTQKDVVGVSGSGCAAKRFMSKLQRRKYDGMR